jgi:parallel beta-helix repeat protein
VGIFIKPLKLVVSSSSKRLTLDSAPGYELNVGEGFILTNKLEFLDSAGEWYYDSSTKTVYYWTPGSDSPKSYEVRGSTMDYGIYINSKDYIVVQNLHILHQKEDGAYIKYSDNNVLFNNTFEYCDNIGIYARGSNNIIKNNIVDKSNSQGVLIQGVNSTVTDNLISNTALFDNFGLKGSDHINAAGGRGLQVSGDNSIISYNRIINSNYSGLTMTYGKNMRVSHNYINGACLVKDDGGGIYTYGSETGSGISGTVISNNILINVKGNKEGYTSTVNKGYGIYMDNGTRNVRIENNTVAHCGFIGIFALNGSGIEVYNNTVMDAVYVMNMRRDYGINKVKNNIFYAFDRNLDNFSTEKLIRVTEVDEDHIFENNTYINHYNNKNNFIYLGTYYTFEDWKKKIRI